MPASTRVPRGSRSSWPARPTGSTWTCAITAWGSPSRGRREASGSPACRSARACSAARASSSPRREAARVSTLSSQSAMASLRHPDSAPIRVLIVDDHPMVREGLRSMLEPAGVDVVGEAGTGEDALRIAAALSREIAQRLHWSVGTVKKYLQRTLEKLGAADRTQAAVEAVKRGLLS